MADTLKRLAGPSALGTTAATIYTTPASTTTSLRNIHVVNTSAGSLTLTMSVGTDAAGTRIYDALTIPTKSALAWDGLIVLAATEVIQAFGSAAGLTITLSGVETT